MRLPPRSLMVDSSALITPCGSGTRARPVVYAADICECRSRCVMIERLDMHRVAEQDDAVQRRNQRLPRHARRRHLRVPK